VQEQTLTERLIGYETDGPEGIRACAGFIKGWLEARDVEVKDGIYNDVPVLAATVGAETGPTVVSLGLNAVRARSYPKVVQSAACAGAARPAAAKRAARPPRE